MNQETESRDQLTQSTRKRFTEAEKSDALKLLEAGRTIKEVAGQFDVSVNSVMNWRKAAEQEKPAREKKAGKLKAAAKPKRTAVSKTPIEPKAALRSESTRLATLRRELGHLEKERHALVEKERDILKEITQILLVEA